MDVRKEIMEFISRKEKNGALLLTGKWGCGKTYLIRQIRDELNKENQYVVVIVSLFGIDSIQGVNRKVKESVFKTMMGSEEQAEDKSWGKKAKSVLSSMTAILGEFSSLAKGLNTALTINPYDLVTVSSQIPCRQNGGIVKKELILVFDDFERSKIDKVELLGAINDYSENDGIKTILVADEEHIDGDEYKGFKEKLISRTVKIRADYANAIWVIVKNYKESVQGYKNFLEKNIGAISLLFLESRTENIRSFKAFLMDFERIYQTWTQSGVPVDHMPDVLYSFGAVLFEYKNNSYKENERYGYLLADGEIKKKYSDCKSAYMLNSLQKWIISGDWNEKAFVDEITYRFGATELEPDQLFLYHEFWDLTQETVFAGVPVALQKAYEGKLGRDALIHLLQRTHMLKKFSVVTPMEIDYKNVSKGIDIREAMMKSGEITDDASGTFILPEVLNEMDPEARELYYRIERLDERCRAWNSRCDFIAFIQGRSDKRRELKHLCIISFDDELLDVFFEAYKTQGNGRKRELILALKDFIYNDKGVSSAEDIQVTIANLEKLETMIQGLLNSEQDVIAQVNIAETLKVLSEFRENLKEAN